MIDRKAKLRQFEVVKAARDDKDGILGAAFCSARKLVDNSEPGSELIGYATIGVYSDGQISVGSDLGKHPIIGRTLFKAMVLNQLGEDL